MESTYSGKESEESHETVQVSQSSIDMMALGTRTDVKPKRNSSVRRLLSSLFQSSTKAAEKESIPKTQPSDNRFSEAIKRIQKSSDYDETVCSHAPYGSYGKRPIIGENTPINGGIFVGALPHEAIVIDEKYGLLNQIYDELMLRFVRFQGKRDQAEAQMIPHIFQLVQEKLRYSEGAVKNLLKDKGIRPDRKAALDIFLQARIGVARHQVLLAAYLMEKLQKRGLIAGCYSIDSMFSPVSQEEECLYYTDSNGNIHLFNPAIEASQGRSNHDFISLGRSYSV